MGRRPVLVFQRWMPECLPRLCVCGVMAVGGTVLAMPPLTKVGASVGWRLCYMMSRCVFAEGDAEHRLSFAKRKFG